jgi:hypothetical protein
MKKLFTLLCLLSLYLGFSINTTFNVSDNIHYTENISDEIIKTLDLKNEKNYVAENYTLSIKSVNLTLGKVGVEPPVPVGFVASGNNTGPGQVFLACGPNNVGGDIVYKLFFALTSAGVTNPITQANEYIFGSTAGDANGTGPFGFFISGLDPGVEYTFWLYQYDTSSSAYSNGAATASQVSGAGGGGGSGAPTTNAPTPPARDAGDVISIFSDAYTNLAGTNFDPNWGQSGHNQVNTTFDPTGAGNNFVLAYPNFNYQGTALNGNQNASEMEFLNVDIWVAAGTSRMVKVSPINNGTGAGEVLVEVPLTPGSWNSVALPKASFTGMTWNSVFQLKFDGQFNADGSANTTPFDIYLDNIYFFKGSSNTTAPTTNAPTPPARDAGDVISIFSDAYTNLAGTNFDPNWGQSGHNQVNTTFDPTGAGNNFVLAYPNFNYQGTALNGNQNASEMEFLNVDIWVAAGTSRMVKVSPINNGTGAGEVLVEVPLTPGSWNSVALPKASFTGMTWNSVFQLKFDGQFNADGSANTTPFDIYLDNIYFYREANVVSAPTTNAPTPPARDAGDVISIFSDAYTNVAVANFDPNWGQSGHNQVNTTFDPTGAGNNFVLAYPNFNYQGTELGSPQNASEMEFLNVDIWVAAGTSRMVKVSPINNGTGAGEVLVEVPLTPGSWNSVALPKASFTGMTWNSVFQLKFDGQFNADGSANGTPFDIYLDNIYFYKEAADEPLTAAPDPTENPDNVISMFSDVYTDVPVDTWLTPWSSAVLEDILIDGNPTKKYTNVNFLGIETTGANLIDASDMDFFHIDVWTPNMDVFRIKLVDFGPDGQFGGGDDSEYEIVFTDLAQGAWNSLQIPLTDFVGLTSTENIAQLILSGTPTGAGTLFVDNVYYSKTVVVIDEPLTAAPDPTENPDDVISMFSDVYTDVPVDTWLTPWSSAVLEEVLIQGNPTKKYTNVDFLGIETTGANLIDASDMDFFHIDVWTPNMDVFRIKLVDFGADGQFGGGDDTEHEIIFTDLPQGAWNSLQIPLSEFTGLLNRENIAQLILSGTPVGAGTLFVDNVYYSRIPLSNVCGGVFSDSGGADGNYSNNEDIVWTIEPDSEDDFVTVIFSSFDVESSWDALYVYNGPDTSSPLISSGNPATLSGFPAGGFYGTTIPGPFSSTHPSGALTFRFLSDGSVTRPGWVAEIVCAPVPPPNDLIGNAISITTEAQPYTDSSVRLQFATNELLNPDGCSIAGTNGVWYSFTAAFDGSAEASVISPSGTTAVIFYEAPNENVTNETELTFTYFWQNQCAPSSVSSIPTIAGQSYYIFVLNTGGPSDVLIDISDSLGIGDNTIDGFTFYPNPVNDILNVRSNIMIEQVEFFTVLGQSVTTKYINATNSQLDISGLTTGVYFMKVTANGITATYQVIKR